MKSILLIVSPVFLCTLLLAGCNRGGPSASGTSGDSGGGGAPTIALFACSDLMALGASEAIAAAGRTGKILVIGFDAQPEARAAIQKGAMAATVAQFPGRMGSVAVESAAKLLRGEAIAAFTPVPIELVK